jgi:hypothetical protein
MRPCLGASDAQTALYPTPISASDNTHIAPFRQFK